MEEVERAVRKLKSGKAGGVCGIQVEMVKAGGYTVVQWLKDVFDIAWKCGKTPHEWREAIIVPIYKKGSRDECGNYRGISLLSVVGKIYARVVCDRLRLLRSYPHFRFGRESGRATPCPHGFLTSS